MIDPGAKDLAAPPAHGRVLEVLGRGKTSADAVGTAETKAAEAAELTALRERIATLEDELETAVRRVAEAAFDERIVLVEEIAALRTREEERGTIADDLRLEGNELRAQLIDASRSVGEAYALRNAVDRAHESLASMRDSLLERLGETEADNARLRLSASTAALEADAVRSALEALRSDYDALHEAMRRTETERDELALRLGAVEEESRMRERAVAETIADLRRSIANRERELTAAGERRAAAIAQNGLPVPPPASVPAIVTHVSSPIAASAGAAQPDVVMRLDAELQRTQAVHKLTVDAFARHIDGEVAMLRAELAEIDRLIRTMQTGRVWSWRAKLGRVKRLLRGGLRRA